MTATVTTEPCEFCGLRTCRDIDACAERFIERAAKAELKRKERRRTVWARRLQRASVGLAALGLVGVFSVLAQRCERQAQEQQLANDRHWRYLGAKARENWRNWSAAFLGDRKGVCSEKHQATYDHMGFVEGYRPVQFCLVGHGHDNSAIICAADGCQRGDGK